LLALVSLLSLEGEGSPFIVSTSFTCPYKFLDAPPYSGLVDKWILGVAVPVTSPCNLPIITPFYTTRLPFLTRTLYSLVPSISKFPAFSNYV